MHHQLLRTAPWVSLLLIYLLLMPAIVLASDSQSSHSTDLSFENTVLVQLGSQANEMRFYPGRLVLQQGERYQLILTNPSPVTHEFASKRFAGLISTEYIKFYDNRDQLVGYVRGVVEEVELLPGGRIEWVFTALQAAMGIDLFCDIPGHLDAGMVGNIEIRP